MRILLFIGVLLLAVGLYFPAQAQPPLWEPNFGTELTDLTGCDDCIQDINFPFAFPFNGNIYTTAGITTNGCIHLNGEGLVGSGDYDFWSYMEEFLSNSDPDNPLICPFESDLDLSANGMIYYNNSNPAVITWDGVGAYDGQAVELTFQALLYPDGSIVINLNGILNGPGESLADLEGGIVIGVTPSNLPFNDEPIVPGDPGPVDLNQGPFNFGSTAYERWCDDLADSCGTDGDNTGLPGPINTAFDLDLWSICFTPEARGFSITSGFQGDGLECGGDFVSPVPTLSEWGLIAMAGILGIVGLMVMRRRKVTA